MKLNLSNRIFHIGYNNDLPFTGIDDQRQTFDGIEVQLLQTLSDYFNFQIKFINCHGVYGSLSTNSSNWTGIIGKVMNNEFDLAIGGILLSYDRSLAINFLYPHWVDHLSFATPPPIENYIDYLILLRPFEWTVWFCLSMIMVIFFLYDNLFKQFYHQQQQQHQHDSLLWINLTYLLRQPYSLLKNLSISMKIIVILWIFATMIISNLYGGFLYSILTIPISLTIDTIDKLAIASKQNHIIVLGFQSTEVYTSLYVGIFFLLKCYSLIMNNDSFFLVFFPSSDQIYD
uniref:Glutamate receptor ionotropic, kainate 4-like n=1 Tax=Dermatophagoides pteronyssinus TaxID=6956 RepID=A0A6P6XLS1_DERPT